MGTKIWLKQRAHTSHDISIWNSCTNTEKKHAHIYSIYDVVFTLVPDFCFRSFFVSCFNLFSQKASSFFDKKVIDANTFQEYDSINLFIEMHMCFLSTSSPVWFCYFSSVSLSELQFFFYRCVSPTSSGTHLYLCGTSRPKHETFFRCSQAHSWMHTHSIERHTDGLA